MNKYSFVISVIILAVFGVILYVTQANSLKRAFDSPTAIPTFPPNSETFQMISHSPQQAGQVAGQQTQSMQQQAQQQQAPVTTFGVEEGVKASYSAVIKTSKGDIKVSLNGTDAPNTVKNFINKSKSNFYKGLTFHRVEDWVVQGGDPRGDGTGGGLIQTEPNKTVFVPGSLGAARGGDIRVSNDSQFFITKTDAPWLNGQYTNFGIVTDGMDVVNKMKIGDKILGITVKN